MNNPEFRQTLHNLSHNLESANQTAQENIYTFTQLYIDPCLSGVKSCLYDCTAPCFPNREGSLRRRRGRSRGRAEYSFDFYSAWEDEEEANENTLRWGDDELDSLLAGRGSASEQPKRQRAMSYGSRGRRKPTTLHPEPEVDPTIIPGSSYLGFLERLPWKIGSRTLRYKPSAADLQEHPGAVRVKDGAAEPLLEENEDDTEVWRKGHGRQRSDTTTSRSTTNSLSSRGDLIMSDEEDDAVPLDDEFAVALSRRMTNQGVNEESGNGKSRSTSGKRPRDSLRSNRTTSSKSIRSPGSKSQRSMSQKSLAPVVPLPENDDSHAPTLLDLQQQEQEVEREEELEVKVKREAARRLALERGLSSTEVKPDPPAQTDDIIDHTLQIPESGLETPDLPEPIPDQVIPEDSSTIDRPEEEGSD
ncbi:hypothetical protein LTR84_000050 [Exophiala bonariae]|uniref:Uncharacterized protein n=1 Tax=Exophiala bonariae TaxID=1690606 RepID=A0AAV9NS88_9EURO|nr:hypothetical protein LTR84_000050 [Exophiala bonariae]